LIQSLHKDEENLSSSEDGLSERQQDILFNKTTKFDNNAETPRKLLISMLHDESSIKKPLRNSI